MFQIHIIHYYCSLLLFVYFLLFWQVFLSNNFFWALNLHLHLPKKNSEQGTQFSAGAAATFRMRRTAKLTAVLFCALSTVGKSIPCQPCCHLLSFWSRLVIYRNLFAQSQYLPVGAVKICNPSLLLPCCFSYQ